MNGDSLFSVFGFLRSRPPWWQPNLDVKKCTLKTCNYTFFWPFRRRHHCRSCGLIFCSEHTSDRLCIDGSATAPKPSDRVASSVDTAKFTSQPVCRECYTLHVPQRRIDDDAMVIPTTSAPHALQFSEAELELLGNLAEAHEFVSYEDVDNIESRLQVLNSKAAGVTIQAMVDPRLYKIEPRVVGSGEYGQVYRAIHKPTGMPVAFKLFNMVLESPLRGPYVQRTPFAHAPHTVVREIAISRYLRGHKNFVSLVDIVYQRAPADLPPHITPPNPPEQLFAVLPFVPLDFRRSVLQGLCEPVEWAKDLMTALHTLHTAGLLHRDLKPDNILISPAGWQEPIVLPSGNSGCAPALKRAALRVMDFGFGRDLSGGAAREQVAMTSFVGSPPWRPPELLLDARLGRPTGAVAAYGPGMDVWAAGIILLEMLVNPWGQTNGRSGRPCNHIWEVDEFASLKRFPPGQVDVFLLACFIELVGIPPRSRVESWLNSIAPKAPESSAYLRELLSTRLPSETVYLTDLGLPSTLETRLAKLGHPCRRVA